MLENPMRYIEAKDYRSVAPRKVAFIGLGVMGGAMAAHLVAAGHHVVVYNRTTSKAMDWVKAHATSGRARLEFSPASVARGADIVIACVGNDNDLREVAIGSDGAFDAMPAGAVFVDHSTVSATVSRELAQVAQSRNFGYVDAPVSGGEVGAVKGKLTIMCGGEIEQVSSIEPVLRAYGAMVTRLGPCGSGQIAKMVNQVCIAGLVQALSEGIALGEKSGLDMPAVLAVLAGGAAHSWQMGNRGETMIARKFDFGFAVDHMRKDLMLAGEHAKTVGASLPVASLVDQFYADVQRMGGGRWDTSSLIARL
ncbi:2-hydroxy-3-oxopropionate reductase [Pandoraea sp. SD6-2]|nr:2-hydroxy-3-oxopropionate reductase [Pandoraea sp. SD6-2]